MFFRNTDSSSPIYPYRKSSGRPAPVRPDFESKVLENVFLSCEKEFLSKEFKVKAAKFKGNVMSLEKLGSKELIFNPDIYDFNAGQIKAVSCNNTSEDDSKMDTILQDKSQYVEIELDLSQDFKSKVVA